MTEYKVKIYPDQYTKRNCLTCKHSDTNNNGIRCQESNIDRWNNCNENLSEYEPMPEVRHY